VLVDKLRLPVAAQEDAEIVKPGDDALQLHAVDEKDRDRNFRLADVIEKGILQILSVASHVYSPFFVICRLLAGPLNACRCDYGTARRKIPPPKQIVAGE